ncbi:LTA synthase family protein [Dyella sp. C9]|uniref:LTA synthase family protein n=1 Tax=Dyella sp. C9 TaxID=2202154 RepID=UPI000DEFF52F|nr:LTA synthase family protein [Dyella sp. C9]
MTTSQGKAILKIASAFLLLPVAAWVMDRLSLGVTLDSNLFSTTYWLSSLPVLILLAAMILLSRRVLLSAAIMLSLLAMLFLANYLKIRYLAVTLMPADYFLLRDLDESTIALFTRYLNNPAGVMGAIAVVALLVGLARWDRPVFSGHRYLRAFMLIATLAAGYVSLVSPWSERIYSVERLKVVPGQSRVTQYQAGLIAGLVQAAHVIGRAFDEPIDRHAANELFVRFGGSELPTSEHASASRPDVIVIQSESFFNPDVISQVSDTQALLPNLREAERTGAGGTLLVPTFGGGTIRTEFEVLTGIPLAAYARVQFPYLQFGGSDIPGLARLFSGNGYETVVVHGNSGTFWNRRQAIHALGFDRFVTASEFDKKAYRDGWYLSDHSMTDEIIGQLGHGDRPHFIFAISIEAHGPYLGAPRSEGMLHRSPAAPAAFSPDARDEYSRYAYHIANADQELGRLWSYLRQRQRPFVLVFYGDHLPPFQDVYREATFRDGRAASVHGTPWIMLGSDVTASPRKQIYAWMLPDEVLRAAGLKDSPYLSVAHAAGQALIDSPAPAQSSDALRHALYSAARLDFNGELDSTISSGTGAKAAATEKGP